jgi:hypothetical protein
VSELTGGAVVMNGDGNPKGVGASLSPKVGDGMLSPGESVTVTFVIGLRTRESPVQVGAGARTTEHNRRVI